MTVKKNHFLVEGLKFIYSNENDIMLNNLVNVSEFVTTLLSNSLSLVNNLFDRLQIYLPKVFKNRSEISHCSLQYKIDSADRNLVTSFSCINTIYYL